jgi:hypothetical protein
MKHLRDIIPINEVVPMADGTGAAAGSLNPMMKIRIARYKKQRAKRITTAKTQRSDQESRLQKAIHDINGLDV